MCLMMPCTGWVDLESTSNSNIIPKLSIKNIHQYFISKKVHKGQVTASKPFERGYHIMTPKKVVYIYIPRNLLFSVTKAAVLPSQKTDKVYETIIVVYRTYILCYMHMYSRRIMQSLL